MHALTFLQQIISGRFVVQETEYGIIVHHDLYADLRKPSYIFTDLHHLPSGNKYIDLMFLAKRKTILYISLAFRRRIRIPLVAYLLNDRISLTITPDHTDLPGNIFFHQLYQSVRCTEPMIKPYPYHTLSPCRRKPANCRHGLFYFKSHLKSVGRMPLFRHSPA